MFNKLTPEEIMTIKSSNNAIIVDVNELGPSLVPRLIMECNNAEYWHKFVVENVDKYERDFILRTIMDFVHPADIIPLNFVKKKRAFFLARNCLDAILKLTSNKLVVPNPRHPDMPLRLVIIANHNPAQQIKFDFEKDILDILKKRYDTLNKYLNLSEFHKDEALKDFFPLSQPKLLLYVLQFAMELQPEKLDLSNNFIKVINPIRLLAGCKIDLINLGFNEIAQMEDLEPLKVFTSLNSLILDGNPLCNGWNQYSYVKKLKEICPNLTIIDRQISKICDPALTTKRKNFLCSTAGGDLVSQFLERFFMVYDSENRRNIAPLYHKNAMFSVTYRIIPNQMSCENIQLKHYLCIDRNLKGFHGPRHQFLFRGRKAIMNAFAGFPRSDHDPYQFQCDLIYYTGVLAVLVVNGTFREDKRYIGFTRTFILKNENDAYTITNDQLHVYNALDYQVMSGDRYPIRVEISSNPLPYYTPQYTELQQAVHKITNLNYDYSARFLEAYHFDLKKTLESFVEMHLNDEVPPEAFVQVGQEGLYCNGVHVNKACPINLIVKTWSKHPAATPRNVWQTLKDDILAARSKITNNVANKDMLDAEAKEIKRKILIPAPNSAPVPSGQLPGQSLQVKQPIPMQKDSPQQHPSSMVHSNLEQARLKQTKTDPRSQIKKTTIPVIDLTSDPTERQSLQEEQPIPIQNDIPQQDPFFMVYKNIEEARLRRLETGPKSQINPTIPAIDVTSGPIARQLLRGEQSIPIQKDSPQQDPFLMVYQNIEQARWQRIESGLISQINPTIPTVVLTRGPIADSKRNRKTRRGLSKRKKQIKAAMTKEMENPRS